VSLSVTAWRLADAMGRAAQCVISERDGRWMLMVQRGREIMLSERWPTDDAALDRANHIWAVMVKQGWTELTH
jgi:hypothetical protein